MDKRNYMKKQLLLPFLLFVVFARISGSSQDIRGLWIIRDELTSPQRIERILDIAEKGGFNTLFLQVRGRGYAFYRSSIVPRCPLIAIGDSLMNEFDPLEFAAKKAHERGFKVHAWLNVLFTWSRAEEPEDSHHILLTNPQWFMVGCDNTRPLGNSFEMVSGTGWYLSPGIPEVRHYFTTIVREIIDNYDVDGIHLDYIRYPSEKFDFHPTVRIEYSKLYGIDPLQIVTSQTTVKAGNEQTTELNTNTIGNWYEFRSQKVTQMVEAISQTIQQKKRSIMLSCAVKPQLDEAYVLFGQDWACWLNDGLVDFVCPMNYTNNIKILLKNTRYAMSKVSKDGLVVGLGAYMVDPDALSQQVAEVINLDVRGFTVFSSGILSENPEYIKSLAPLTIQK